MKIAPKWFLFLLIGAFASCLKKNQVPPNTYTPTDSTKVGLTAYYPFTGTLLDSSGNKNNPTTNVGASLGSNRFNKANSSLLLNGSAYLVINDDSTLRLSNTDFTLNYWINCTQYSSGNSYLVISKRGSGLNNGWSSGFAGLLSNISPAGSSTFTTASGIVSTLASSAIPAKQWHMITVTYSLLTKTETLYIDGVLNVSLNQVPSPNSSSNGVMVIGGDSQGFSNPNFYSYLFQGSIDDIRIYRRSISQSIINKLYNLTY